MIVAFYFGFKIRSLIMNINFFSKYSLLFLKNKKNIINVLSTCALSASVLVLNVSSATASSQSMSKLDMAHKSILVDYGSNDLKNSNSLSKTDPLQTFLIERNLISPKDVKMLTSKSISKKQLAINIKQNKIVDHITEKYKNLNRDTAEKIVKTAYIKADKYNIDPEILIAIAGVESNYNPKIVNRIGASGLTQVVKRYHRDKIRKVNARGGNILSIADNLDLGAEIYSDLYHKYGNHTAALQAYNGSLNDKSRTYSKKVMRELNDIKNSS